MQGVQRIEDLTAKAQARHREGRTLEAISLYEKALEVRINLYGAEPSLAQPNHTKPSALWAGLLIKFWRCTLCFVV
jgi:hypothetical protein